MRIALYLPWNRWPALPMPFVKELRIDTVQLPHAEGKVSVRRFNQQMIVVVHETVGVADPIVAFIDVLKGVQEVNTILVVFEDGLFLIAAGGDVINSAGIFYAKGTGHAGTLAEKMENVKVKT